MNKSIALQKIFLPSQELPEQFEPLIEFVHTHSLHAIALY